MPEGPRRTAYQRESHINVGTGQDLSIRELAELVRDVVHPGATLTFDPSKPDGMPRKLLDVSRLHALGWRHVTSLRDGIRTTYEWHSRHRESLGTGAFATRSDSNPVNRDVELSRG